MDIHIKLIGVIGGLISVVFLLIQIGQFSEQNRSVSKQNKLVSDQTALVAQQNEAIWYANRPVLAIGYPAELWRYAVGDGRKSTMWLPVKLRNVGNSSGTLDSAKLVVIRNDTISFANTSYYGVELPPKDSLSQTIRYSYGFKDSAYLQVEIWYHWELPRDSQMPLRVRRSFMFSTERGLALEVVSDSAFSKTLRSSIEASADIAAAFSSMN